MASTLTTTGQNDEEGFMIPTVGLLCLLMSNPDTGLPKPAVARAAWNPKPIENT